MTKVVSGSPWLVDFATGLVDSVFYYPNGQVKVYIYIYMLHPEEYQKFI